MRGHPYVGVSKETFDSTIARFVERLCFTPDFWSTIEAQLLKRYEEEQGTASRDAAEVEGQVGRLNQELLRATDAFLAAKDDFLRAQIETRIQRLRSELEEAQREEERPSIGRGDILKYIDFSKYVMEHLAEILILQRDALAQQDVFRLVFTDFPTYTELANGTPKIRPIVTLCSGITDGDSLVMHNQGLRWNTLRSTIGRWKEALGRIRLPFDHAAAVNH